MFQIGTVEDNVGQADYYAPGDWNVNCALCGRKLKASTAVKNWQGTWRCPQHSEPRHPQDFVRGIPDVMTPEFTQVAGDTFVVSGDWLITEDSDPLLGILNVITDESNVPLITES